MEEMVAAFTANHNIDVEWRLVSPMLLPQLVETAVSTTTLDLPDLILHPIEFTVGWAERGILDPAAAEQIIEAIGRDTFNPNALELAQVNGRITAIPSDGFQQLIIYRQDWFERDGLAPPDTYEAMLTAAETTSDTVNLINSFVIPTESNLRTTHQAFEHLALGNGCELIDNNGRKLAARRKLSRRHRLLLHHCPQLQPQRRANRHQHPQCLSGRAHRPDYGTTQSAAHAGRPGPRQSGPLPRLHHPIFWPKTAAF
jgi:hypothetical protein